MCVFEERWGLRDGVNMRHRGAFQNISVHGKMGARWWQTWRCRERPLSAVLSTQYRSLNPRQTEEVRAAANDSRLPPFWRHYLHKAKRTLQHSNFSGNHEICLKDKNRKTPQQTKPHSLLPTPSPQTVQLTQIWSWTCRLFPGSFQTIHDFKRTVTLPRMNRSHISSV